MTKKTTTLGSTKTGAAIQIVQQKNRNSTINFSILASYEQLLTTRVWE